MTLDSAQADKLSAIAAIIASAAAVVSIPIAVLANRTSRRALVIAEHQARELAPRFVIQLLDCAARVFDTGDREISVSALITNASAAPNSVIRAELLIDHVSEQNRLLRLLLSAQPVAPAERPGVPLASSSPLIRVEAYSAASTTLLFRVPASVMDSRAIRRYELILTDAHQETASVPISMIKEIYTPKS